jgi:aerobic-type carbon monoxide dehydrogenase small subunit (CoxS/CutS family)
MLIKLDINGRPFNLEVEPRTTLADCLRHKAKLTGTHVSCAHGVCGACTVIMDGVPVRSCLVLAVQADQSTIQTVEGLSNDADLSPLQKSFRKYGAVQCGFCTAGILMSMHSLLSNEPEADEERIREILSGHLCRCTGYIAIIEAVLGARDSYKT